MCQRVIELDPEAAEIERKARQKKMMDEAHEEWEAKPDERRRVTWQSETETK